MNVRIQLVSKIFYYTHEVYFAFPKFFQMNEKFFEMGGSAVFISGCVFFVRGCSVFSHYLSPYSKFFIECTQNIFRSHQKRFERYIVDYKNDYWMCFVFRF